MKTTVKTKTTRAAKRDLFAELGEGMTALAEASQGKRTLRTHAVEFKPGSGGAEGLKAGRIIRRHSTTP